MNLGRAKCFTRNVFPAKLANGDTHRGGNSHHDGGSRRHGSRRHGSHRHDSHRRGDRYHRDDSHHVDLCHQQPS